MKMKTLLFASLFALVTNFAYAQLPSANANLLFTIPGTLTQTSGDGYGPNDTFTLSLRLNYPGTPPTEIESISYWLEVPDAFAPFITITSQVVNNTINETAVFTQGLAPGGDFPMAFTNSTTSDPGMTRTDSAGAGGDLGGATPGAGITPSANTYYVSTLTFQLSGAPQGSFTMQTTLNPPTSVANSAGTPFTLPPVTYTMRIIPEPATWSLMALGAAGCLGLTILRRKRRN